MAWMCSGSTNDELIDRLKENGLIVSDRVAAAMKKVDRRNYVSTQANAYEDSPQWIGFGVTISAPHMHAHAAENLLDALPMGEEAARGAVRVLDVGCGSGYLTAVLHHLAPSATIIGIDHIPGLVDFARDNLHKDGVRDLDQREGGGEGEREGGVRIICGDGRLGSREHAPFQVIHVGAAAPQVPEALLEQLAKPGRMFIPVGEQTQDIWQIDKDADGELTKKKLFGVKYVPLTDAEKQWRGPM